MERSTCKFHGGPYDECGDAEREWFPQLTICYPTMQERAAQHWFEELHKDAPWHDGSFENWRKEWSPGFPFHFSWGTQVWISRDDLGLGGDFLEREKPDPLGLATAYESNADHG